MNEVVNLNEVGVLSSQLESIRIDDPAEADDKFYHQLEIYKLNRTILWGSVCSVTNNEYLKCISIDVLFGDVQVSIPEKEFFMPNYNFGSTYDESSPTTQKMRRRANAEYYLGAKIPFVIKGVSRKLLEFGDYAGQYETICYGSRLEAMKILQDIWFFHTNRKLTDIAPRQLEKGMMVEANVLAARGGRAIVEACGVETILSDNNRIVDMVTGTHKKLSAGDTVIVKVTHIYLNDDNTAMILVSERTYTPPKAFQKMKEGELWSGYVDTFNPVSKTYTIILTNGVQCICNTDSVKGRIPLSVTDRVKVKIKTIRDDKGYCVCSAEKI